LNSNEKAGCVIGVVIIVIVLLYSVVFSPLVKENQKNELMALAKQEISSSFPQATDVTPYQVDLSEGYETFSSLATDIATVHVIMKIDSIEKTKYVWFKRTRGDKWYKTDIRER
jgi:hypothetical protein